MGRGVIFSITIIVVLLVLGVLLTGLIEAFVSSTKSTPSSVIDEILKLMKLKKGDKFADLGMGRGRVLIRAIQTADVKVYGFEMSPILAWMARFELWASRLMQKNKGKYELIVDNFLTQDQFKDFNGKVYCYLPQPVLDVLELEVPKLLKNGAMIYTYELGFKKIKPTKVYTLSNQKKLFVY